MWNNVYAGNYNKNMEETFNFKDLERMWKWVFCLTSEKENQNSEMKTISK